jgi:SAM-dependent methyltransferase
MKHQDDSGTGGVPQPDNWERPETVARFAARDIDHRLAELIPSYPDPAAVRVLDIGCAGGRNAEPLARAGFDVHALDSSRAMVERTGERLAVALGAKEAGRRVRRGRMDDLSAFADESIDLVIALGVFQMAESLDEWARTLDETARVLAPGGQLLVATFAPGTEPRGVPLERVPGERFLHIWSDGKNTTLISPSELDDELARRGLEPLTDTVAVHAARERGTRVTVNGLYRKQTAGDGDEPLPA